MYCHSRHDIGYYTPYSSRPKEAFVSDDLPNSKSSCKPSELRARYTPCDVREPTPGKIGIISQGESLADDRLPVALPVERSGADVGLC